MKQVQQHLDGTGSILRTKLKCARIYYKNMFYDTLDLEHRKFYGKMEMYGYNTYLTRTFFMVKWKCMDIYVIHIKNTDE